ncbi:MAG: Germination-specific N-acetylmuramoyl-L-alanine amidase precursor [Firmicutes bacterium ADurb.Bin506]|nr:MAG: Germination-specific N-acetylmuramoyl-L-alanine amidase precursor [Firmicutes bacterium ADurb.Bin506]
MTRRVHIVFLARDRTLALIALLTLVSTLALLLGGTAVEVMSPARDAVSGRVVAIDAGHGGPDGGAVGKSGVVEKHINLHIALELQRLLGRSAVHTVMTRTTDTDLASDGGTVTGSRKLADLKRRAVLVNEAEPDIFISIHSNSFPEPQWSGGQVFYSLSSEEGRRLAVEIQTKLAEVLGPNSRKARPADIYLLHAVKAPSALVEVGFLSNPREERLLSDPTYRVKVAGAIYQGIISYMTGTASTQAGESWGTVQRVSAQTQAGSDAAVLYFGGPTNMDGALVPEVRQLPGLGSMNKTEAVGALVSALLAGPGQASILQPTVPAGVVIRSVAMSGDVAVVDFSSEFIANHWGGSAAEEMTIYSIVNTLTELPYVKAVKILVEGQPIGALSGHLDLEHALQRNTSMVRFRS